MTTAMTERTAEEEYDEEIEQMATARAEIEQQLRETETELKQIGAFGEATCTGFEKDEDTVTFAFRTPDGETRERQFDIDAKPESFKAFIAAHDADSVTDMVGVEHACIYTDSGWVLWRDAAVNPRLYYARVSEDRRLMLEPWAHAAAPWAVWSLLLSASLIYWQTTGIHELFSGVVAGGVVLVPLAFQLIRVQFGFKD